MKKVLHRLLLIINLPQSVLEKWKRKAVKYIHGRLVDIGCGKKQEMYFDIVSQYVGVDYEPTVGIDIQNSEKIVDVFASADNLPFKENEFDTAISYMVLEHLKKTKKAVQEAYRILKKGGHYIVTVPFIHRIHYQPYDYFRYTEFGLKYLFENAGFEIVDFEISGGLWFTIGSRMIGYFVSDILGLGGKNQKKNWIAFLFLPIILPLILMIALLSRLLDKIHRIETDPYYYYIVGRKK